MSNEELHELEPEQALEMYVTERRETDKIADSTVKSIRSRVGMFADWCRKNGIDTLHELDGMDLHQWRLATAQDISERTLASRLSSVRSYLRWARDVDAVHSDLPAKIDVPDVESPRERTLESGAAESILDYLRKFDYASRDHVIILLFWRTGMRLGALRGIDLSDYYSDNHSVELVHRPETDTPLKNRESGERFVSLSEDTCTVIDDYLIHHRPDSTDKNGREPLLTTKHGRIGEVTVRRTVYRLTRPCVYSNECPVEKNSETCEAAQNYDRASRCPETVSPHDIRRGALTHMLRSEIPERIVSDRSDVSPDVLDKHYNQMTEREKMEQRRDYLDKM
ncbi:tyrosine-type recombinase/integrase [Haloarcula sp. JP-L23]|uniref:tyrosine-type recombinase/integrase n=1 Tax=Haloarcula sp. JP-L23 TaxID=2716717 RepID=UPI00140EFE77|nr:tyrosine-type recombinase/integrase [Haloarcula sp. JP-L23]